MTTPRRDGYHHGDLRVALLHEAVEAARAGGPGAVTLREVTRRAGVSPGAAYRHFADRDELVRAVTFHGQAACARVMEARTPDGADGTTRLRAVGLAYVEFAQDEPGLFEAAFLEPVDLQLAMDPRAAGDSGRTPFGLLADALDAMVADGALPAGRRPLAEVPCWSSVHGLAMLAVRGPLRGLPREHVDALAERVVDGAVLAITRG